MITSLKSSDSTITFNEVVVRLDGKIVGKIKYDEKTRLWSYYPTGSTPGEGFTTLEACQRSLQ